jgi:hypothetical protein
MLQDTKGLSLKQLEPYLESKSSSDKDEEKDSLNEILSDFDITKNKNQFQMNINSASLI